MFKKLTPDARLPERATKYSAGFDVFANEDVVIGAGESVKIGLGIVLDFDSIAQNIAYNRMINLGDWMECHYFALHIRSSLRAKGLTSLGTGIIDMDYRDEIKMVIYNPILDGYSNTGIGGYQEYTVYKGDKIGQLILCRHEGWLLPSEYTKDEERTGGFGSTDKE